MGEQMQKGKVLYLVILTLILIIFSANFVFAQVPDVSARTAVVMDVITEQILYDKHMHIKMPPASTTKVLTTIIAIEESNLNEVVIVSRNAAYQEGSSIWLREGEKLTLEELLYGIMLSSANDAAVAVAEHIAGSVEKFAVLMNKR